MKILLSNKFYYRRGGDCVCTINLEELLKRKGHEVAVFAMQHPDNLETPWNKYFPSEIKFKLGICMIETLMRPFGTREVMKKFKMLLDDFQPDVIHLGNIHSQLSPVIAELAYQRGIKVVWTLHDYKLLCPRYDCCRSGKDMCEECFMDKHKILKYRCMKNSCLASFLAYKEAMKWTRERLEAYTDIFICPSKFMADKMQQGGFDKNKLRVLCNFIDIIRCKKETYEKADYYCYVGRISSEKGIRTLIEAANQLPYKLIIIGKGPIEKMMQELSQPNIEFVGFKQWNELKEIVGRARFAVIPSEWYENNPLSVIEALCLGTPVLGARIGGIPELIEEGVMGMTFESRNVDDLKNKILQMFEAIFNYERIAQDSQKRYDAETYYRRILNFYSK